ncbi:peptide deformylase, partial [Buchnera aphidicola]|nr:peptide deformylase [Buchnera aphidicola]
YPDPRLKIIAKPISKVNKKIKKIAFDMIETMHYKEGIGLAATQVNIPLQIIVINIMQNKNNNIILINPKIIKKSGNIDIEEGCLSIPYYTHRVKRSNYIKIQALDLNN